MPPGSESLGTCFPFCKICMLPRSWYLCPSLPQGLISEQAASNGVSKRVFVMQPGLAKLGVSRSGPGCASFQNSAVLVAGRQLQSPAACCFYGPPVYLDIIAAGTIVARWARCLYLSWQSFGRLAPREGIYSAQMSSCLLCLIVFLIKEPRSLFNPFDRSKAASITQPYGGPTLLHYEPSKPANLFPTDTVSLYFRFGQFFKSSSVRPPRFEVIRRIGLSARNGFLKCRSTRV